MGSPSGKREQDCAELRGRSLGRGEARTGRAGTLRYEEKVEIQYLLWNFRDLGWGFGEAASHVRPPGHARGAAYPIHYRLLGIVRVQAAKRQAWGRGHH